jgi:hypothetical protein
MATHGLGLRDVSHGLPPPRARLLAPLRYLLIAGPEKASYDFVVPGTAGICVWGLYMFIDPKPHMFGDAGLLRITRDLLMMGVPFMVGALAAVAMGGPGAYLDRRPIGTELYLNGESLTLRRFVCYLLGYLSFLGLVTLIITIVAELLRVPIMEWTQHATFLRKWLQGIGTFFFFILLSALSVTVLWSLYFLTDVVNRTTER